MKEEIRKEIESEVMNTLDLDNYNITSEDLKSSSRQFVRGVDVSGHPLVPKLDFREIIER